MASHMKYKLPSFRLTKRSAGLTTEVKIPRGRSNCTEETHEEETHEPSNFDASDSIFSFQEGEDNPGPSLHEIKQKSSVTAWDGIRDMLRHVAIESSGMPFEQTCITCSAEAKYRCVECAAWAYYCPQCFDDAHSNTGIYHTGEVWEVSVMMEVAIPFFHQIIIYRVECSNPWSFKDVLLMFGWNMNVVRHCPLLCVALMPMV